MRHALTLLLGAALAFPAQAQRPTAPDTGLETFEAVWNIIDKGHFDPDFNGVDWPAVREELRPRAEVAEDMDAVRDVIREMLATLRQSHFSLIEKEHLGNGAKSGKASPAGTAGFDIRFREGAALVSRVDPGGPAYAAGVRAGWMLSAVDGVVLDALLAEAPKRHTLRPESRHRKFLLPKIDGEVGSRVALSFETETGAAQEVGLARAERDAVPFDMPGLPTFYLVLRAGRIEHEGKKIGVLHFSNWFAGIEDQVHDALVALRDCDGIVIDLRGNSGGEGTMATRVAGHFFDETTKLGTQVMRRGTWDYTIRPRRSHDGESLEPFDGPLVILADETTGSCSEVFTGGMQALGRACVIGEQTAGAALPGTLTELPNEDYLLHAIGDFVTARGESMEGDGLPPDQVVPLVREDLLAGRDAALGAAVDWISTELEE